MIATLAQRDSKRKRVRGKQENASAVVHPRVYTGVFCGFGVRVDNPYDAADLCRCGHYGKGTLSRGEPIYDHKFHRAVEREHQKHVRVEYQRARQAEAAAAAAQAAAATAAAAAAAATEAASDGATPAPAPAPAPVPAPAHAGAPLPEVKEFTPVEELRPVESLQLSLVEAYFLCSESGVGCLTVMEADGSAPMSPEACWEAFTTANPRFPELYAVYHFLRSRGWVPKGGLKFGTDFIIYKVGPNAFHADYSVVVASETSRRAATWTSLQALARTTLNVAKDVLVAHVVRTDPEACERLWRSPEVLGHLRPRFTMVQRWNEKRNR